MNEKLKSFLFFSALLVCSCAEKESVGRSEYLVVSETTEQTAAPSVYCRIDGGADTLYVFSNVEYESFFQTSDAEADWVSVQSAEPMTSLGATRIILNIAPAGEKYTRRTGTFSFVSKENYLGQFVVFTQGFGLRLTEQFNWLAYGAVSPLDAGERQIDQWTAAQKEYQWSATAPEGGVAATYGKFGCVRIGDETTGGDLITPFFSNAITRDTLLLLTFNAVAHTDENGTPDANRLFISTLNGGVFSNGSSTLELNVGNFDVTDPNFPTSMWSNSAIKALILNTPDNPFTADMKIRFHTPPAARNRVYIDDINVFVVDTNSYYLVSERNKYGIQ